METLLCHSSLSFALVVVPQAVTHYVLLLLFNEFYIKQYTAL